MHSISNKLSKLGFYKSSDTIDIISHRDIPPLREDTRKQLIEKYFLEDIQKLEDLIKQDLKLWK